MEKDEADLTAKRTESLGRRQLGGGRLGTYTMLGAVCGVSRCP